MTAPRHAWLWLLVGLAAASQSGNLIRLGHASPVAIAAWRLLLSVVILAPFGLRSWATVRALGRRDLALLGLAGAALALHWFTWIAAVQKSTVANAAVFISVNPVLLSVAGALFFGERIGRRLLIAIGLGLAGVLALAAGDFRWSPNMIDGDLFALASAALFAIYFLVGKRLRTRLDGVTYVTFVYGAAGVVATATLLLSAEPLVRYDGQTWLCFALMALVPTLLGHTGLNVALRYFDVSRISVATLSEPILASAVAAWAWEEAVTLQTAVGYGLISASVLVLVFDFRARASAKEIEAA